MKKLFIILFCFMTALSWAAYDIPVGDIFLDASTPAAPDTVWYIFNVDGTDIDSVDCYPTYYRYDTVFSRTDAGSTMVVYLRARFSSGREGFNSYLYSINEEWAHQSTVDSVIDSLNSISAELAKAIDSVAKIIDSLESQDDWIAYQTTTDSILSNLFITQDSLFAALDSIQAYLDATISSRSTLTATETMDSLRAGGEEIIIVPTDTSKGGGNIGSVGQDTTAIKVMLNNNPATFVMVPTDTAEGGGSIGSTGQDTTAIKTMILNNPTAVKADVSSLALEADVLKALDSLAKIIDSLENLDNWGAHQTTSDSIFDSILVIYDSLFAVLDSIQNHDDWIAHQSTIDSAMDSLNSISGELAKSLDSLAKIIDSLESQDDWIAKATELAKVLDSLGKVIDSLEVLSGYSTDIIDTLYRYVDSIDALVSSAGGTAAISDADMSAIMDSLFARLVSDTLTGTYLSTLLSSAGSASGGGAFTVNVYVLDSSASNAPVTDAPVFANNTAQSMSNPYFDLTDNNGLAIFNLDAADWTLLTNKAGYNSLLDTVTISAATSCTLFVYSSAANKTPVFGILQEANGVKYSYAEIRIDLIAYPRDSLLTFHDSLITQTIVYDTADINGYWSINLYSNDSLSDSSYYKLMFRDQYGKRIMRESDIFVHVPQSDTAINFYNLTRKRNETGAW